MTPIADPPRILDHLCGLTQKRAHHSDDRLPRSADPVGITGDLGDNAFQQRAYLRVDVDGLGRGANVGGQRCRRFHCDRQSNCSAERRFLRHGRT